MEHDHIDGLVQYGSDEIPGATRIVNPAWRELNRQLTRLTTRLRRHQAILGATPPPDPDDGQKIACRAETALWDYYVGISPTKPKPAP